MKQKVDLKDLLICDSYKISHHKTYSKKALRKANKRIKVDNTRHVTPMIGAQNILTITKHLTEDDGN